MAREFSHGAYGSKAPASESGRYKGKRDACGSGFGEFAEGAAEEVEEVVEQVKRNREEHCDDDDGYRGMRGGEPG